MTDPRQKPCVEIDYERYEEYLETSDLSDEQKRQFIAALWNVIVGFVDLGFGVHPVQQAQEVCGQHSKKTGNQAIPTDESVEWSSRLLTNNFDNAAASKSEPGARGFKI